MNSNNLPTRAQYRSQKHHKHFYSRWWFWLIIIVILAGGGATVGMKITATGPFKVATTKVKKKDTTKKKVKKQTGVTFYQYNGIYLNETSGTPIETVHNILGKPSSTSITENQGVKTELDTWNDIQNGQLGSTLKVSFANGHAISKALNGLKVKRSEKLGLDAYSSIQNGQSVDAIHTNLGKPNSYSESLADGKSVVNYTYSSDVSGDTGANFVVTFTDGSVSGKSQSGMEKD